jgi:hypothetical protein
MPFSLLVAVPSHSASIHLEGAATLLALRELALARGWGFEFIYESSAGISELRNVIAGRFLASGADLLVMLDSDQAASAEALQRMIDFEQPIVGAIYPKRRYYWDRIRIEGSTDLDELLYPAHDFVGYLDADEKGEVEIVDGFARAVQVGTGLIVIRRETFERLIAAYPELRGTGFCVKDRPGLDQNWGFFNPLPNEHGAPLSEDISFCRRWRSAGGEIWANIVDPVPHIGLNTYSGNYLDYLNVMAKRSGAARRD